LGIYGNEEGWCFPNLKTLGDDLGKSKQSVSKDIKALVELGYIQSKHQYRDDGSQRGNLYRLLFDEEGGISQVDGGSTPEVDGGQLNTVDGGSTPEVDGGQLNTVDGGSTPEVDAITSHVNDLYNDSIENNNMGDMKSKICALWNIPNGDGFETLLTTQQHIKMIGLLDRDAEKCFTIAQYYANEGLYFQKAIGKIINNFDTWKTQTKNQPNSSGLTFNN
jgi:hypothetical protein